MSETSELLTAEDVCRRLNISRPTLYRRVEDGSLRAFRLGATGPLRFEPEAVEALLRPAGRRGR
jgi:excisionase family DNA binding protein